MYVCTYVYSTYIHMCHCTYVQLCKCGYVCTFKCTYARTWPCIYAYSYTITYVVHKIPFLVEDAKCVSEGFVFLK